MPRALPWIVVAPALAACGLSACDIQGADAAGASPPARDARPGPVGVTLERPARAPGTSATLVVDLPVPYAPPGCDDVPAAGGKV